MTYIHEITTWDRQTDRQTVDLKNSHGLATTQYFKTNFSNTGCKLLFSSRFLKGPRRLASPTAIDTVASCFFKSAYEMSVQSPIKGSFALREECRTNSVQLSCSLAQACLELGAATQSLALPKRSARCFIVHVSWWGLQVMRHWN